MPQHTNPIRLDERRLLVVLYIGTLALLLILAFASYTNMRRYTDSVVQVRRQIGGIRAMQLVLTNLQDLETGARGYLLTNDSTYLEPYRRAQLAYAEQFIIADSIFSGTEMQGAVDTLRSLGDKAKESLAIVVAGNNAAHGVAADEAERLASPKAATDAVRLLHRRMLAESTARRDQLLALESSRDLDAPSMIIVSSLLAIVATALLFWRLSRSLRLTDQAGADLQHKVSELAAEVAVRASLQDMLRNVLDSSPNGIMAFRSVKDPEGKLIDFEFLAANRQANAIAERSDLVGKRLMAEMPGHFTAGLFDAYVRVVETGVPFRKDLRYQGSGTDLWFATHAVRFEDGFLVTFADITDLMQALEVNTEADRIALTGQITRTVAHEVRNPLTNIHLAVEQLHDEVQDRDEIVLIFFQIIDRNLKRIGTLINEMLESSKKRELDLVPCKVEDIAENAIRHVADRLALKGIKSEVSVSGDLPEVLADSELINLAITNITINAVEAMEPGKGELQIHVHRVGAEVLMEISDNGKGIPPEDLGRLFMPFYSGRPGGLGLGLTTARSILNSHQIKLEVRSIMGEGTTFTLRCPKEVIVPGA